MQRAYNNGATLIIISLKKKFGTQKATEEKEYNKIIKSSITIFRQETIQTRSYTLQSTHEIFPCNLKR